MPSPAKTVHSQCIISRTKLSWRRKWQPTPVLLPGKFHGQRSLVGTIHGVAKSQTQKSNFLSFFKLSWTFVLLHEAVFSVWMPPFGGLIIEGLQQRNSSGASARTSLSGKEKLLQDSLLHSDSILRTLLLLSFSSCP